MAEEVASFESSGEGVVFLNDSVGFVSDLFAGRIYRLTTSGELVEWARAEMPIGHEILRDGVHIVADLATSTLLRFDRGGSPLSSVHESDRGPLVSPNDLVLAEPELSAEVTEGLLPTAEAQQTLDGMAFDGEGNLFVAYHRIGQILVLDPSAEIVRRYDAGQLSVSNVAFAGPEPGTLYAVGALGGAGTRGVITRLRLPGVSGWRQFDTWPLSAR